MNPLHKHKIMSVGYQVKQNLKSRSKKLVEKCESGKVVRKLMLLPASENVFLSFFLSWVSKTQPNHWTKWMANTRLAAHDPRTCPGPEDVFVRFPFPPKKQLRTKYHGV